MNNAITAAGLAGLLVVLVIAGTFLIDGPELRSEYSDEMMDTYVQIIIYNNDRDFADSAADAALERMEEIETIADRFVNTSEVSRLNDNGSLEDPSPELVHLLETSVYYWNATHGAFDITILPLLDLWNWETDYELFTMEGSFSDELNNGTLSTHVRAQFLSSPIDLYRLNDDPDITFESDLHDTGIPGWKIRSHRDGEENAEEYYIRDNGSVLEVYTKFWNLPYNSQEDFIQDVMPFVGSDKITITDELITLHPGMKITLDGIAKGYAVDEGIRVLKEKGVKRGLVNAGGDLSTIGSKPGGGWISGLSNPEDRMDYITRLEVSGKAIATSGNYERYYNSSKKIGHIMDPSTGRDTTACSSTTIVAENCSAADILATAIFVLGPEEGIEVVESMQGVETLILGYDNPRDKYESSGLGQYEIND